MTDSSTGGYLTPTSAPPAEGNALDDILHNFVVGLTGLAPTLVFPRWQPQPPTMPAATVNWGAIGVTNRSPAWGSQMPDQLHYDGYSVQLRQQQLDVIATFYGPDCDYYAAVFLDGMTIAQNWEPLADFAIKLYKVGNITRAPELVNTQYIDRTDVTFSLVREIARTYAIQNMASASINIVLDSSGGWRCAARRMSDTIGDFSIGQSVIVGVSAVSVTVNDISANSPIVH